MRLFLSLALVFATKAVFADLVVTQKIEGGGQSGEQTIRVKDNKARCDVGSSLSVIVDRQSGESTTLVHAQRGFITLSAEKNQSLIEKMQKTRGTRETPKLLPTGKKEKIGEYQCEVSSADLGGVKVTYWLAKDYPNYATYLEQLDVLESAPLAAANNGLAPRQKELPGMPMKILMEMGNQKVTITLLSLKEENVDPSIFIIPKDYKELPSPPATPPQPAAPAPQ